MNLSSTIAAIATPPGQGAIALIRISGPESISIAGNLFAPFPSSPQPRFQYFGKCLDNQGTSIDEVLLTWFRAPASFTGEDVIEIACHGGSVVSRLLLERIYQLGAQPAEPGEFSQRAFLNGKIDLTQAEAIMDLIEAQTELAVKAAGGQLAGALSKAIETLRQDLIEIMAHVEAYIDFPDEDIDPESKSSINDRLVRARQRISQLLATADRGRILREGIHTVICGAPNAGKSSLLNHLLGFDRAIVSDRPGTTRDTIEETINLAGIPLRLVDTAGIRDDSDDEIEKQGIGRSQDQIESAELVLLVIDSSQSAQQLDGINITDSAKVVKIFNKVDLPCHSDWAQPIEQLDSCKISCKQQAGLTELQTTILQQVTGDQDGFAGGELVSINSRHQHYLQQADDRIEAAIQLLAADLSPEFVAFEIRETLEAIGAVVGKTDVEEILGSIFSSFCIGK